MCKLKNVSISTAYVLFCDTNWVFSSLYTSTIRCRSCYGYTCMWKCKGCECSCFLWSCYWQSINRTAYENIFTYLKESRFVKLFLNVEPILLSLQSSRVAIQAQNKTTKWNSLVQINRSVHNRAGYQCFIM